MPTCSLCGRTEATAEMRRRRPPYTGEWRCKDPEVCRQRQKQNRAAMRAAEIAKRKGKAMTAVKTPKPELVLDGAVVAPRTKEQRYRIYRVKNGGRPDLVATCRTQGEIGTLLCRLGEEGMFEDHTVGIMDGRHHKDQYDKWVGKWLVKPWVAGGPSRKEMKP